MSSSLHHYLIYSTITLPYLNLVFRIPKQTRSLEWQWVKLTRFFLLFDKPFWTPGSGSIKLAWDDAEKDTRRHNVAAHWFRGIFAFDEVLNNPSVLGAWVAAHEAEYMETLSDEEVIETCTQLLRKFLANPSIPAPKGIMRSKWCTNPLFLGSYSYICKHSTPADIEAVAKPVLQRQVARILFAGEATSLHHYSTMHGARDSGLREAERLLDMYSSQSIASKI